MKLPIQPIWIFLLVALVQLAAPASMILGREAVLRKGKAFHFESAPVDPNDPFRGKYITLSYKATTFPITDPDAWTYNQDVFVLLDTDSAGFARIAGVLPEAPEGSTDYLRARVSYIDRQETSTALVIDYPFDRFYMDEFKAKEAELAYNESLADTLRTYAVVHVKDGQAVLADVMIDDRSIREWVKERQQQDIMP